MLEIDPDAVVDGIKRIANETLLPKFAAVTRHIKDDGSFVTEADVTTQEQVAALLRRLNPEIPMLGEEMSPDEQQQLLSNSPLLWC
ncbi:MAG: inositol monophosphatase, partial [Gammaproteobacteria bacterium]|nr:inositol monophosphatase [Gammaproteobacteria bacterium]